MNKVIDYLSGLRSNGIDVFMIPGNHDMPTKANHSDTSLKPLAGVATVIDRVSVAEIYGRAFIFMPFLPVVNIYCEVLEHAITRSTRDSVIMTHIGCTSALTNTCFMHQMVSVPPPVFDTFRTYTGHYHIPQSIDNKIFYCGGLLPFKFDEGGVAHGFYVLDTTDMSHEFIDIRKLIGRYLGRDCVPPDMLTIHVDDLQTLDDDDIYLNKFRIAHNDSLNDVEQSDIKKEYRDRGALEVIFYNIGAAKSIKPIIGGKVESKLDMKLLLDQWVTTNKLPDGLDINYLNKINAMIIESGEAMRTYDE
jgi:DNA repair exonuclease SbcCD nuclease subunit